MFAPHRTRRNLLKMTALVAAGLTLVPCLSHAQDKPAARKPNIIVIMCDDAGFADFGFTGGVGKTPTLDRLAADGMVFARAYNNGRCMPTRQSFMTGLNPQLVHDWDRLGAGCVTLAEALNTTGYDCHMIGKWHLGTDKFKEGKAPTPIPTQRGFKSFFGTYGGFNEKNKEAYKRMVAGFLAQNKTPGYLYENERIVQPEELTDDYYESFTFSDRGAEIIRNQPKDRPFFLFMSYTSPHWNLAPRPEYVARYDGVFERDWEEMRKEVLQRQIAKGLMPASAPLLPVPPAVLEDFAKNRARHIQDTKNYYSTISDMDAGIERLIKAVQETGREKNTLVLFLSDNGGEPLIGGACRAMLSNTPLAGFKVSSWEGAIAAPFVAWWPGTIPAGTVNKDHEIHLEDFMATFVELAGAQYPKEFQGRAIYGLQGRSFYPALKDSNYAGPRRVWVWEHDGSAGVWSYPWKAVFLGPPDAKRLEPKGWRLFKLDQHRVEKDDLSQSHPEQLKEMIAVWKEWAKSVGVRAGFEKRKAQLPPEHEDAPRPNPATWDPTACPVGRLPKPE